MFHQREREREREIMVLFMPFIGVLQHSDSCNSSVLPSTGSVVTSCDACHERASCSPVLKAGQTASSPHSSNCTCSKGFSGDGMSCYNTTICSAAAASCCAAGYRWSAEQGCVDVDECTAAKNPCAAPLVCQNTPGSFTCLLPQVNGNPQSSPRLVQFSCGRAVCSLGQDCITINGFARCADPCQEYTILDDPWRSTNYKTNGLILVCETNSMGWYRMYLNGVSVQMPERCIQPWMCGTNSPLWLKTPHPVNSDGVMQGTVCGSWIEGCCNFEFNIHVKACPGNYYVYKFVKPPLCYLAYACFYCCPFIFVPQTNSTHAVYSNTLFLDCIKNCTLNIKFSSVILYSLLCRMQEMGLVGLGPGAHASMSLYRNANFTDEYPSGSVVLPVGAPLYVGVNVDEVEASRFAVVLDECYITDTPNSDKSERYQLIQNRCPSDPRDVTVVENGVSLHARFTALLFLYQGNYNEMYLHCGLSLCDRTTESCKCRTRTTRSIPSHKSLTLGPINRKSNIVHH
uniref:ZP domain-containing protein n=1 Tax=Astyanax mexicanus TaxID=7994 RepID=A0A3B1IW80_ASTMX